MKYAVIFEKTKTGFNCFAPDLPGCVAAASTLEKTATLMRGAIRMHLDAMRRDGELIPEPTTVAASLAVRTPRPSRPVRVVKVTPDPATQRRRRTTTRPPSHAA